MWRLNWIRWSGIGICEVAMIMAPSGLAESAVPATASDPAKVVRVQSFELEDQYGKVQRVEFPRAKPVVITVAGKAGASEVDGWVKPMSARLGDQVDFVGVASLGPVPGLFRGRVREGFRKQYRRSVLLDWAGVISRRLGYSDVVSGVAVMVVGREGQVLGRFSGSATEGAVRAALVVAGGEGGKEGG